MSLLSLKFRCLCNKQVTFNSGGMSAGDIEGMMEFGDDDSCLVFVSNFALKSMRLKQDKWTKMMSTDDYRVSRQCPIQLAFNSPEIFGSKTTIFEWRQNINRRVLLISLTSTGGLSPALGFPVRNRGKTCYFIKKGEVDLNAAEPKTVTVCRQFRNQGLNGTCLAGPVVWRLLGANLGVFQWIT